MAGLVITIAQRKGGAGKTTLAAQLAIAWARQGARLAVLDIDPQGSLAAWVELRRRRLGANAIGFDFAALPGWRAPPWIEDRAGRADVVAVRAAGLVLIPVQPSPLDFWATEATLKMAREERRRALVVLNRVPPRSALTDLIAADLATSGAPVASTRIGNRIALVRAMASGLGVIESAGASSAATEIEALAEEVRKS